MDFLLAYIDAGTGSILLQVSLAGVFAVAFFFRQLKGWFRRQICRNQNQAGHRSDD